MIASLLVKNKKMKNKQKFFQELRFQLGYIFSQQSNVTCPLRKIGSCNCKNRNLFMMDLELNNICSFFFFIFLSGCLVGKLIINKWLARSKKISLQIPAPFVQHAFRELQILSHCAFSRMI